MPAERWGIWVSGAGLGEWCIDVQPEGPDLIATYDSEADALEEIKSMGDPADYLPYRYEARRLEGEGDG